MHLSCHSNINWKDDIPLLLISQIINNNNILYVQFGGGENRLGICKNKGYGIQVIKKGNTLHRSAARDSRFRVRADKWAYFPMGAAAFFGRFSGYNS
jgi:hypothetical protein